MEIDALFLFESQIIRDTIEKSRDIHGIRNISKMLIFQIFAALLFFEPMAELSQKLGSAVGHGIEQSVLPFSVSLTQEYVRTHAIEKFFRRAAKKDDCRKEFLQFFTELRVGVCTRQDPMEIRAALNAEEFFSVVGNGEIPHHCSACHFVVQLDEISGKSLILLCSLVNKRGHDRVCILINVQIVRCPYPVLSFPVSTMENQGLGIAQLQNFHLNGNTGLQNLGLMGEIEFLLHRANGEVGRTERLTRDFPLVLLETGRLNSHFYQYAGSLGRLSWRHFSLYLKNISFSTPGQKSHGLSTKSSCCTIV